MKKVQYDAKQDLPNKDDVDFSESIDSLIAKDMKYTNFIMETKPKLMNLFLKKLF